jgi:hypothetical protein
MSDQFMTIEELKQIPLDEYPFIVFADNIRGLFSWAVKVRTKGSYGHLMWLIGPNQLATQSWYFHKASLDDYSECNMKLVSNPSWPRDEKVKLLNAISVDLRKPWYKTIYDFPAILGQLLGLDWLQSTHNRICSECINYLSLVDPEFALWFLTEHTPNPSEVNLWTKSRGDRFKVRGRYSPD